MATAIENKLTRAQERLQRAVAAAKRSKEAAAKLEGPGWHQFGKREVDRLVQQASEAPTCEFEEQQARHEVLRAQAAVKRMEDARPKLAEARKLLRELEPELERLRSEGLKLIAVLEAIDKGLTAIRSIQIAHDELLVNELLDGDALEAWRKRKTDLDELQADRVSTKRIANSMLAIARSRVFEIEPLVNRLRFNEQQYKGLVQGLDPDDSLSWTAENRPDVWLNNSAPTIGPRASI